MHTHAHTAKKVKNMWHLLYLLWFLNGVFVMCRWEREEGRRNCLAFYAIKWEKINKLFECLWHIALHYFNNCLLFVYGAECVILSRFPSTPLSISISLYIMSCVSLCVCVCMNTDCVGKTFRSPQFLTMWAMSILLFYYTFIVRWKILNMTEMPCSQIEKDAEKKD